MVISVLTSMFLNQLNVAKLLFLNRVYLHYHVNAYFAILELILCVQINDFFSSIARIMLLFITYCTLRKYCTS